MSSEITQQPTALNLTRPSWLTRATIKLHPSFISFTEPPVHVIIPLKHLLHGAFFFGDKMGRCSGIQYIGYPFAEFQARVVSQKRGILTKDVQILLAE